MGKEDAEILVVNTKKLFGDHYFDGFQSKQFLDYESRILEHFTYMRRGDAEVDLAHKQPIPYAIVVNPKLKKVFVYKRSPKAGEGRLHGKYSWGVGGHVEKIDSSENPVHSSFLRELKEEVDIKGKTDVKVLGYINDDSNSVGKVHFCILYLVETDATEVIPKADEIATGGFKDIAELRSLCSDDSVEVETWSQMAVDALQEHFDS